MFAGVGAGANYLAVGSPHRGGGTGAINATLLNELRAWGATQPPAVWTTTLTTDTVWEPLVERSAGQPDLGYHYPALDYAVSGVTLNNVRLTLTNGVAVAVYGTSGLKLTASAKLASGGTPMLLNRLVRHNAVQEQSLASWSGGASGVLLKDESTAQAGSEMRLRFTELVVPAGGGHHFNGGAKLGRLALTDCEVQGGSLQFNQAGTYARTVALTNNVFHRVAFSLGTGADTTLTAYARNNLFRGVSASLNAAPANSWEWRDNLFDTTSLWQYYGGVANGNNAFRSCPAGLTPAGSGIVTLTALSYAADAWGRRWYVSTTPSLVNAGSRSSGAAGLWHHTTQVNQGKEGNTQVDIGFHYVACDSTSGQPWDTDTEGLPDYFEDTNGDGIVQANETNPAQGDTDADGLSDATERIATGTDPLDPDGNGNGVPDGEDYELAWGWSPSHPYDLTAWSSENPAGTTRRKVRLVIPRGVDALHLTVKAMTLEVDVDIPVCNDELSYSISGPAVPKTGGNHHLIGLGLETAVWKNIEEPHWVVTHSQTKQWASYLDLQVSARNAGGIPSKESVIKIMVGGVKVEMLSPTPGEKHVFSVTSPGILTVPFIAQLSPPDGISLAYVRDHVWFSVDGIGDSALTWENSQAAPGKGVYDDEISRFRNTAIFMGLPTQNSAFGPKAVRLSVTLWGPDTEWTNKVFYPARGFNHPGPTPPLGQGQGLRPANYFYYYQLTSAGIPPTAYGPFYDGAPGSRGSSGTQSSAPWRYFVAIDSFEPDEWDHDPPELPSDPEYEVPKPGVNSESQRPGRPKGKLAYIDLFAWAARHERAHHLNTVRFWGWNTPPNPLDGDRDWLPDTQEPQLEAGPYSPTTPDSHTNDGYSGTAGIPDRERHNCNSTNAEVWDVTSADEEDWAAPGIQYNNWHELE